LCLFCNTDNTMKMLISPLAARGEMMLAKSEVENQHALS